jgi:GNAT superfamily N-acetyltransferase
MRQTLKDMIKNSRDFCGDSKSILTNDLTSYINDPNQSVYYRMNPESNLDLISVMTVTFKPVKNPIEMKLEGICVNRKHRGKNGGRIMMNYLESLAKQKGITKISLVCYGKVAYEFYKHMGYTKNNDKEKYNSNNSNSYNSNNSNSYNSNNSNNRSHSRIKYVMVKDIPTNKPRNKTQKNNSKIVSTNNPILAYRSSPSP